MKRYVVIAGVNGAGKTTFFSTEDSFSKIEKINFDETVRSIGIWTDASDVKAAGEIVLKKIEECFERGASFSQETTLCGKSVLNNIRRASETGYNIELYYIGLETSEIAKERVKQRVERGGHGISDEDIERRYHESLRNLKTVLPLCDVATVYDNSNKLTLLSVFRKGICEWRTITPPPWYVAIDL